MQPGAFDRQSQQEAPHEEEDISVYKGNSWQLDLRLEKGVVRSPSGRALDVVESLSAHNNVLVYQRHVTDMLSVVAPPEEPGKFPHWTV